MSNEEQGQDQPHRRYIGTIHNAASKFLASEQRGDGDAYASKNAVHMKAALEAEQHRVTADFLVRALHDLKGEQNNREFVEVMDQLTELWARVRPRVAAG